MSYVIAAPEMMTAAATDLAGIGSALIEEHTAAAALTVGLLPAAADEGHQRVWRIYSRGTPRTFRGWRGGRRCFMSSLWGT